MLDSIQTNLLGVNKRDTISALDGNTCIQFKTPKLTNIDYLHHLESSLKSRKGFHVELVPCATYGYYHEVLNKNVEGINITIW